ncbi:sensor histidine kinase [Actinomycetospora termitidis]|uniref:histidine kinase n=1 Tax=Actinomycetospora termitidis TaxID=3053470 RepID=A0ABT7M8I0_9PSEU|nr:histidine kinase [Actinomycetospora sp. Odt1-22]MDL5156903.1 histidine kinase [Actinomycetospora sp. Odt1-22]
MAESSPLRTWVLPGAAAAVTLAIAWPTAVPELGVGPAVALPLGLAAALPVAGIVAAPMPAWALSFVAALVVAGSVGEVPGDLWPVAVMHGIALLALLVAVVLAARWWEVLAATVATAALFGIGAGSWSWGLVIVPGLAVVAWLGRQLVTSRRQLAASEEASELERARRAVLEERARIARDLHDVVAHSMSMIVVRTETAAYRLPGLPDDARGELADIGAAARASLGEVRTLLGVLHDPAAEAARTPAPGLDDVDELLEGARRAGMALTVDRRGTDEPLGAAAGLSLHRILAESLANAARHAAGAPVEVVLDGGEAEVRLAVTNPSGEDAGPGSGIGVPGMRDRAAVVGGQLEAGPGPDGGWRVSAVLPREVP